MTPEIVEYVAVFEALRYQRDMFETLNFTKRLKIPEFHFEQHLANVGSVHTVSPSLCCNSRRVIKTNLEGHAFAILRAFLAPLILFLHLARMSV